MSFGHLRLVPPRPRVESVDCYPFGEEGRFFRVGKGGVTRIREVGDAWVGVFVGEQLVFRIAANLCQVAYQLAAEAPE